MSVTKTFYGTAADGSDVHKYDITNSSGYSVSILDYGCRVLSIMIPDADGKIRDVALGLNDMSEYLADDASIGAVVGRYANRIAGGEFSLNDTNYKLACNSGVNHLHGGDTGFGQRIWKVTGEDENELTFTYISADGEEGYPGRLEISVCFHWTEDCELSLRYQANADADTILNVTNHTYFNLNGFDSGDIFHHELRLGASTMTEMNENQIPTGRILPVSGTPFDFQTIKEIGKDIHEENAQLALAGQTYDHNMILDGSGLREAAVLQSKESGIRLTCFTDQPAIQIYSPCYALHQEGKNGYHYEPYAALCLETQHYPDSVHHPEFPSVVLPAGETFHSTTIYNFSTFKA